MQVVRITDNKWKIVMKVENIEELGFRPEMVMESREHLVGLIKTILNMLKDDYNHVFGDNLATEVVRERDSFVFVFTKSVHRTPEELLNMVTEQMEPMQPLNPVHFEDNKNDFSMFGFDTESSYSESDSDSDYGFSDDMFEDEKNMDEENRVRNELDSIMAEVLDSADSDDDGNERVKGNTSSGLKRSKSPSLSGRRATPSNKQMLLALESHDFEAIIGLAKQLDSLGIVDSTVYHYDKKYMLFLTNLNMSKGEWQDLKAVSLEFMTISNETEHVLKEYGKTIMENDAIAKIVELFHKEG